MYGSCLATSLKVVEVAAEKAKNAAITVAELALVAATEAAAQAARLAASAAGTVARIGTSHLYFMASHFQEGAVWFLQQTKTIIVAGNAATGYVGKLVIGTFAASYLYGKKVVVDNIVNVTGDVINTGVEVVSGIAGRLSDDVKNLAYNLGATGVLVVGGGVLLYAVSSSFAQGVGSSLTSETVQSVSKRRKLK